MWSSMWLSFSSSASICTSPRSSSWTCGLNSKTDRARVSSNKTRWLDHEVTKTRGHAGSNSSTSSESTNRSSMVITLLWSLSTPPGWSSRRLSSQLSISASPFYSTALRIFSTFLRFSTQFSLQLSWLLSSSFCQLSTMVIWMPTMKICYTMWIELLIT